MSGDENRTRPTFRHMVIDDDPPGSLHDVTLIFDINGNGLNDILIAGKSGEMFWYENPYWTCHPISYAENMEAGGVVHDITGDGYPDVVVGTQMRGPHLYWFEHPGDPTEPWPRRIIENRFDKYHDQIVGDIDGDGGPELIFISQVAGILAYYDIPADPRQEPWPETCFHLIAEGVKDIEGLALADLDGDGQLELVAGTDVYKRSGAEWAATSLAKGLVKTRCAVADLDGDGVLDIVFCEGESHPGRLLWCRGPDWEQTTLRDDLFHPHSLEIADMNGNGQPDILVAEMGLGRNENPRMAIWYNLGGGGFEEVIIQEGVATHEAKVGDLTGNGLPDIVGKPYNPERRIDVWINGG